jgi:predicted Zn finger-like uncharacterized protein
MTLMRIHCPVCEAVLQVSDECLAAARDVRCGQCGLSFVPRATGATAQTDSATGPSPTDAAPPYPGEGRSAPMPPSVIYVTGDALSGQSPPVPQTSRSIETRPHPASGATDGPDFVRAQLPAHAPPGNVPHEELGPPPPYRPIAQEPRAALTPVEMAPTPPPAPLNIRSIGALGPPPPYRPIIQAGAVFQRGPAPDLEPWRLASLARAPTTSLAESGVDEPVMSEADWTLPREAEPPVYTNYLADQIGRSEFDPDPGPNDPALAWPGGVAPPRHARLPAFVAAGMQAQIVGARARKARRLMWAVGVIIALIAGGATVYAERGPVRRFLVTIRDNASSRPVNGQEVVRREPEQPDKCAASSSGGAIGGPNADPNGNAGGIPSGNASETPGGIPGADIDTDVAQTRNDGCVAGQSATVAK